MKKINLTDKELNDIKQIHLDYCKKYVKYKKLSLSDEDCRKLFIENPFDENMNLKRGYGKFRRGKTKMNFITKYESFRSPKTKKEPEWSGAKYIQALKINVCPYCGQQYFSIVKNKLGNYIAEATLDHYYDKSDYPFLALNLYNLIPVCKNCNSSFKLNKSEHIVNPYIEALDDSIYFKLNNLDISNYLNQDNIGVEILHPGVQNVINHLNILELEKRYNYYQNIIKSTIYKRVRYNKNYITQISNIINKPPEFIEASLIKQDLFSENEPFLKLKSDIWEQIQ